MGYTSESMDKRYYLIILAVTIATIMIAALVGTNIGVNELF